MIFNFQIFRSELLSNDSKKDIVIEYEKVFGKMKKLEDTAFFQHYVSLFEFDMQDRLLVPKELKEEFDWQLLTMLVACSFSSEYQFILNEELEIDLEITVKSGNQKVTKLLSELWRFQILRLFEIYLEENISLYTMKNNEPSESDGIKVQGMVRLNEFDKKIKQLKEVISGKDQNENKSKNEPNLLDEILKNVDNNANKPEFGMR